MKQSLDTRTKLLTKNPISLMIELSIPAVLGMVVVGLYNMMDSIFVGQMVGAAQMGAVSVSYPFTLISPESLFISLKIILIVVVFPVPGPPVIITTPFSIASLTAIT